MPGWQKKDEMKDKFGGRADTVIDEELEKNNYRSWEEKKKKMKRG